MRKLYTITLILILLFFAGCSSKQIIDYEEFELKVNDVWYIHKWGDISGKLTITEKTEPDKYLGVLSATIVQPKGRNGSNDLIHKEKNVEIIINGKNIILQKISDNPMNGNEIVFKVNDKLQLIGESKKFKDKIGIIVLSKERVKDFDQKQIIGNWVLTEKDIIKLSKKNDFKSLKINFEKDKAIVSFVVDSRKGTVSSTVYGTWNAQDNYLAYTPTEAIIDVKPNLQSPDVKHSSKKQMIQRKKQIITKIIQKSEDEIILIKSIFELTFKRDKS